MQAVIFFSKNDAVIFFSKNDNRVGPNKIVQGRNGPKASMHVY